jgi:hypothetical protein
MLYEFKNHNSSYHESISFYVCEFMAKNDFIVWFYEFIYVYYEFICTMNSYTHAFIVGWYEFIYRYI